MFHFAKHVGWRRIAAAALCLSWLLSSAAAHADDCSDFPGGVLDGATGAVAPAQINIDRHCTIRNFPASNPLDTNFSFFTNPGQNDERWIVIFDNVVHTGQMACNAVAGHKIWFTNGSSTSIQEGCQNYLIPVEKIDKENPPGDIATVGVPFTYTLTMPVLFDPATETVINFAGSLNDLHGATLWDDLNETGVDLTYVSHVAYWRGSGLPVAHTFSNVGGALTFDDFPIIPAGEQIVVELTVVLDDTPTNTIGTQFINTARWDFGRLIDGEFFEPLPGESGISPPMTIGGPDLVLTKTGDVSLNLGETGDFRLDVQNAGTSDAWDATVLDVLPDGATGGMCDAAPVIQSARVYQADGTTPVAGKDALVEGADYTLDFDAAACELSMTMLTPNGVVGPGERLIVDYQARLDDDTQNGASLTNVAGLASWFNGDASNPARQPYLRPLTDGSVGIVDHEDAHTLTAALTGVYFEKAVANLTNGVDPAATAAPGDTLRYTLTVRTTDSALNDFDLLDDLGALNPTAVIVPGSLTLNSGTVPPGADAGNTDPNGGTNGAGLIDIRGLDLPADSSVNIEFDVTLLPVLANGTVVTNQADLTSVSLTAVSDDPNVNGLAYPDVAGDEDPTRVTIVSAPLLDVDKVSSYLDGDPNLLLAGERMRYTITVQNVGDAHATDVMLRDAIPANTTYVAGSTTLNGAPLADVGGTSALVGGVQLYSPRDATPGYMPADASGAMDNVATIQFEVTTLPDLMDGTVISNQAFVDAVASGINDLPSDDPRTPAADDPTRDVVGNVPALFATKTAALLIDNGSPDIVDPGDTLRYTITVYNSSVVPATSLVLQDGVPGNTSYVADSTTLNGLPLGQPDSGIFPLQAGVDISGADLTPPLPGPGEGTLNEGQAATVQFDLVVAADTPRGTLIVNQAEVRSAEVAPLLTDGDGNPATGPEPTVVVVGDAQQLSITKQVSVLGGGPALRGSTLDYTVRVRNIGAVPAYDVYITDDLDDPVAGQLTFVAGSWSMNADVAGVNVAGSVLTADFGATYGPLQPGEEITVRFQAEIFDQIPLGTTVTNRAVVTWNTTQTASASVSIDVGGVIGSGTLLGNVWHDANFNNALEANERRLAGWTVELYRNDERLLTAETDDNGAYQIYGIPPNYLTTDVYRLSFVAPGAGANSALLGEAYSADFTNGLQEITDIVVLSGSYIMGLDLPIDPNGVVYHSLTRTPLAGASLSLVHEGSGDVLPEDCFDDPRQQNQVTRADGYYKFDLNFGSPACPSGEAYRLEVVMPGEFVAGYSELIPPASGGVDPFDVPGCPGSADDAVLFTADFCEAQVSPFPPSAQVAPQSPETAYYVNLLLSDADVPGSSQLFNNHIPVDPVLEGVVAVAKTTPMVNVRRGQLVPYTITVNNSYEIDLADVDVVDRFPAGFRYIEGSARLDGEPLEPEASGNELRWPDLTLPAEDGVEIDLLLAVGSGVSEGEFVNRAQAMSSLTGVPLSGEARAAVRLVADPAFDCADVIGKVYDDENRNGLQDDQEPGIPNVRVVTARGLTARTDAHGRFHFTCPIVPHPARGSNFVLKVDDRSLPSGYRASTDMLQVQRATRGKTLRFSFGASIHRVVGLDIADALFEPGTTDIRPQWLPRFALLLEELQKHPATLRLSYLADVESEKLAEQRLRAVKRRIVDDWAALDCCYRLVVEPQIFWRLGRPAEQAVRQAARSGRTDDDAS